MLVSVTFFLCLMRADATSKCMFQREGSPSKIQVAEPTAARETLALSCLTTR